MKFFKLRREKSITSLNFNCTDSLPENLSLAFAISNEPQHNLLP